MQTYVFKRLNGNVLQTSLSHQKDRIDKQGMKKCQGYFAERNVKTLA